MNNTETETKLTWRTVDYIGGGFVLQVRVRAEIEKEYRKSYRSKDNELWRVKITSTEDHFDIDTDTNLHEPIRDVYQKHRVVHVSDLEGVDMGELVQEVEERGGFK